MRTTDPNEQNSMLNETSYYTTGRPKLIKNAFRIQTAVHVHSGVLTVFSANRKCDKRRRKLLNKYIGKALRRCLLIRYNVIKQTTDLRNSSIVVANTQHNYKRKISIDIKYCESCIMMECVV